MKARFEFPSDEAYFEYIRDYFAAMAMQGMAINGSPAKAIAKRAVELTDALIAALSEPTP